MASSLPCHMAADGCGCEGRGDHRPQAPATAIGIGILGSPYQHEAAVFVHSVCITALCVAPPFCCGIYHGTGTDFGR